MSAATMSACPKCGAENPIGAKFCASCRNPLGATAAPPPRQPPMPPPTTPLQGLMSTGGKAATQNFAGSADAIHAHVLNLLEARKDTDIEQSSAPSQIVASAAFKDWLTTGGVVTRANTDIRIAAIGEQQSQVSVQAAIDSNTTNKVWGVLTVIWVLAILRLGIGSLVPIFALACFALTYWLLQTEPVEEISNEIFDSLRKNEGALATPARTASVSAQPGPPPAAAPAPTPEPAMSPAPQAQGETQATEEEIFERIAKLAKLKDVGAITETEFETKKAELLARI